MSERMMAPVVLFTYNRPEHTKHTIEALAANEQIQKEKELVAQVEVLQQQLKEKQIEEEADEVVKTYDVVLRVKPEKVSQIKSEVINGQKCLVIPMAEDEHANVNGVNTTV